MAKNVDHCSDYDSERLYMVRPSQTVDEDEDGFEILATFYDDLCTKKFIAKSCTSSSYF